MGVLAIFSTGTYAGIGMVCRVWKCYEKCHKKKTQSNTNIFRAWWKRQPDVDQERVSRQCRWRQPSTRLRFSWSTFARLSFFTGRRRLDWAFLELFMVDVDQTELFYWLTSTRLSFSIGRRQPDWAFLLVDVLVYSRRCRRCWRPFNWRFHHALFSVHGPTVQFKFV